MIYTVNKNVLTDSGGILLVDGQEIDVKSDKNWSASKYLHRFWSSTPDPLFGFFFFSVTNCVLKFFIFFWTSGAANTLASLISTQINLLFTIQHLVKSITIYPLFTVHVICCSAWLNIYIHLFMIRYTNVLWDLLLVVCIIKNNIVQLFALHGVMHTVGGSLIGLQCIPRPSSWMRRGMPAPYTLTILCL